MEILVDTHALIWWMLNSPRLSRRALDLFKSPDVRILVSAVIAWELSIKVKAGKITPPELILRMEEAVSGQQFFELPITVDHAVRAGLLPLHHRDPFDRLIVAQAQALKIAILSADRGLDEYDVRRVW